jgi:hypothetical protein
MSRLFKGLGYLSFWNHEQIIINEGAAHGYRKNITVSLYGGLNLLSKIV